MNSKAESLIKFKILRFPGEASAPSPSSPSGSISSATKDKHVVNEARKFNAPPAYSENL